MVFDELRDRLNCKFMLVESLKMNDQLAGVASEMVYMPIKIRCEGASNSTV